MRRYMEKIEYSHLGVRNLSLHRNQKFKKAQFKVKKMPHRTSSPLKRPNHVKKTQESNPNMPFHNRSTQSVYRAKKPLPNSHIVQLRFVAFPC